MVFSDTIENNTEIWFIVEEHVPIPLRVPLKPDFIIEWSSGTELNGIYITIENIS